MIDELKPQQAPEPDIDPIAFDDEKVFGDDVMNRRKRLLETSKKK